MKINRHDQAKILSPQEIAWLFDGKVGLVADLKLLRLLVWSGKGEGMEAIASLPLLSYTEGLPTERDLALFGICLYMTARIAACCYGGYSCSTGSPKLPPTLSADSTSLSASATLRLTRVVASFF